MRYILALAFILCATPSIARDYTFEIRQAQRVCRIQESPYAPSCRWVRHLIALQRLAVEARVAKQTGQPMPDRTAISIDNSIHDRDVTIDRFDQSPQLMYNPSTQKWCWSYYDGSRRRCY